MGRAGASPPRALLALALTLLCAPPVWAWTQDTSEHGVGLRWSGAVPRPHLVREIPGALAGGRAALRRAMAVWRAECSGLRFGGLGARGDISIVYGPDPWPFGPGEAAHTRQRGDADTGALRGVVIYLNGACDFGGPRPGAFAADLTRVLAHELGHAIGVGHSLDRAALMYPGLLPDTAPPVILDEDDVRALCAIYPHGPEPASKVAGPLPLWAWLALVASVPLAGLLLDRLCRRPAPRVPSRGKGVRGSPVDPGHGLEPLGGGRGAHAGPQPPP